MANYEATKYNFSAADLVVNTQGAAFGLVYSGDATTGWTYTEK